MTYQSSATTNLSIAAADLRGYDDTVNNSSDGNSHCDTEEAVPVSVTRSEFCSEGLDTHAYNIHNNGKFSVLDNW